MVYRKMISLKSKHTINGKNKLSFQLLQRKIGEYWLSFIEHFSHRGVNQQHTYICNIDINGITNTKNN